MATSPNQSGTKPRSIAIVSPYTGFAFTNQNYNRQDLGLARALKRRGHDVRLVRCGDEDKVTNLTSEPSGTIEEYMFRSLKVGSHGFLPRRAFKTLTVDVIIHLADIQLSVPGMRRFCKRSGIAYYPYIGTLQSTREGASALHRFILSRNLSTFRTCHCVAKTPHIEKELRDFGVRDVSILPVGLDAENLRSPSDCSVEAARAALDIPADAKVVLFIGKQEAYRNPLALPAIFAKIREVCPAILLLVGSGTLEGELSGLLEASNLDAFTRTVKFLPQSDIWQAYRAANVTLNLNPNEIFGMSILESLFYGTPVVAVTAPGPSTIISDGVDGFLVDLEDKTALIGKVVSILTEKCDLGSPSANGSGKFTWEHSLETANLPF